MAKPEEIGSVVAFLAGPGASYLTATTIFANGGSCSPAPGSESWPASPLSLGGPMDGGRADQVAR